MAESAAFRQAVSGAMVFAKKIVEHARGEDEKENGDCGLFHAAGIIPRPNPAVNLRRSLIRDGF